MNRQAWRDFLITLFFLSVSFIIALLSSIAAEQSQPMQAAIAAAISLLLALFGALYIIPKLARNVRLEILRFAVRTTVTVEGLLFIIFLAVIAFAAWNTANNLLYLVFSAMLAFLIAANMIARMSLADVSIQLRFPDHIFAGEPAKISVTIINHKRLMPSYSLMVEALSDEIESPDDGEKHTGEDAEKPQDRRPATNNRNSTAHVASSRGAASSKRTIGKLAYFVLAPARASARLRIEHTFDRRGRYPITGFRISTKFPAGFFKKWRRIDAAGEILVYPKPKPLDDFYHALPMLTGRIQSQARGSGDDLYAIRRYHPSDHMRYIDWKATAKTREMMVRDHMREDEWRLTIVFDTARPETSSASLKSSPVADPKPARRLRNKKSSRQQPNGDGQLPKSMAEGESFNARFERAVVMAASLANHFILERADVELITPNEKQNVAPGSGYEHLYKILRSLATLEPTLQPATQQQAGENGSRRRWKLFGRGRVATGTEAPVQKDLAAAAKSNPGIAWRLLNEVPVLADERRFKVLITSAAKGTIPAHVWRSAHVVFIEDL